MSDWKNIIIGITSSKEYLQYNKYHEMNLFGITKTSRLEHMHSNFLAWLLSSRSGHGLGAFPIKQFLSMLVALKERPENHQDARLDKDIETFICQAQMNQTASIGSVSYREIKFKNSPKRAIDILIEVTCGDKTLPVVIENKVDSSEHDNQTDDYYTWAETQYKDKCKYFDPLYVFLTPAYNKSKPQCTKFLQVKYQDMVDYVLEPSLWQCSSERTADYIKMYMQCLSYQADNNKGVNIMAITKEEREILENFYSSNKNLIIALTEMMADDDDVDPTIKEKMKQTVSSRDYSRYTFEGNTYLKSRLVLAVIKRYVADKNPCDFHAIESAFPKDTQGSYGVIKRLQDIKDSEKKYHRFYNEEEILLGDGTAIVVCTQWGSDNIGRFISKAQEYGYVIEKNSHA